MLILHPNIVERECNYCDDSVLVKLAKQAVLAAGQLKIHFWCVMPC
jgi:hypothetical protein